MARASLTDPSSLPPLYLLQDLICYRPALFIATVVVAFLVAMGESANSDHPHYFKYSTVTGYFLQDDPATNHDGFDYVSSSEIPEWRPD